MLRKRNFASVLVATVALLLYLHRPATRQELIGTYVDSSSFPAQLELHPDGSVTNYASRQGSSGHWQLQTWWIYEDDLILTSDDKVTNSYNDQYLLTRRGGHICIEPKGDDGDEYWCKETK
jgi:hypothetical protein